MSSERKERVVSVRFSEEEYEALRENSGRVPVSRFIRQTVVRKGTKPANRDARGYSPTVEAAYLDALLWGRVSVCEFGPAEQPYFKGLIGNGRSCCRTGHDTPEAAAFHLGSLVAERTARPWSMLADAS